MRRGYGRAARPGTANADGTASPQKLPVGESGTGPGNRGGPGTGDHHGGHRGVPAAQPELFFTAKGIGRGTGCLATILDAALVPDRPVIPIARHGQSRRGRRGRGRGGSRGWSGERGGRGVRQRCRGGAHWVEEGGGGGERGGREATG
nr:translation initiation factor IF-2-like [Aegilops tauschii subsp. strangulata]